MPNTRSLLRFTQASLGKDSKVRPLESKDVARGVSSWSQAFAKDPAFNYIYMPDKSKQLPTEGRFVKMLTSIALWLLSRKNSVITVGNGASLAIATPPPSSTTFSDKLGDVFVGIMLVIIHLLRNKQQRQRQVELSKTFEKVINEKVGDRKKDMMYISLVCTHPDSQGKGYAHALVDAICKRADSLGKAIWLESSNIANEKFYRSHGFVTIGEAIAADNNPLWKEGPIHCQVMVREPTAPAAASQ